MNDKLLLALAGTLVTCSAVADVEVERIMDFEASGFVEISNVAGLVEVRGWSREAVEVRGTLGDDVEELIFERDDDHMLIKVRVPRNHGRNIESELYIRLPERSTLEVSGVSADIDIDGVYGEQSLQTVSGDIDARGVSDDIEVGSVSGDVTIVGTGEDIETEAGTVSGDVVIENVRGSVEAASVSGDVSIENGDFEAAEFETVNGDLEFSAGLRRGGELGIESVNGTVDVRFSGDVSARFDVETFNGNIRNCFGPEPERTSRYSPGLELSFTEGDGDGHVSIETLNGDVRICKD